MRILDHLHELSAGYCQCINSCLLALAVAVSRFRQAGATDSPQGHILCSLPHTGSPGSRDKLLYGCGSEFPIQLTSRRVSFRGVQIPSQLLFVPGFR
jgi:hypothetical protein